MIEVEKRSLISSEKLMQQPVQEFLGSTAKLKSHFKRFTLIRVENEDFTPNPNTLTDLKVRTTENKGLLTIKYGNWHSSDAREEYEIEFNPNTEFKSTMNILRLLGQSRFITSYLERFVYEYDQITITLDRYKSMSNKNLIELELGVQEQDDVSDAINKIEKLMQELKLTQLTSESTQEFIAEMNSLKECQVDFNKVSIEDWYKTHREYVHCNN